MLAIFLTALFTFFVTTLFGHIVHWSLHQNWTGAVHQAHMTHHLRLYPAENYSSDKYRNAGKDSTPKFFLISSIPIILTPILLWYFGIILFYIMLTILITEIVIGFMHNYLHDAFHIKNHFLNRVPIICFWFKHLTALHYFHHVNMSKNYLIIFSFWDRVFKTFTSK